ncbi:hypothetical protein B2G71_05745 [Novosphingobium sp. PC22D]|uniref:CDP-alcohol phosphatidyltransferase family protein n=1 Tax=Novosphingobium sp. PC22D TaxID=1962403 RepID=UPI000BF00633|nr:CDP-alcohol phosphatidyltransferase family protein [Novosphingobium sp. PC22D]PEQ13812.1 hypothetical protein B2G71_05745 [Novosphingobium sp. PC22D]
MPSRGNAQGLDAKTARRARRQRPTRPVELQDRLNRRLYHPLAWRLASALARTPATPNQVSVLGALMVMAAAYAYSRPGWPLPALAGLALHMAWHVVDGADGDLARLTGRSGPKGELVDGICDYAGHIVLYLTLGAMLVPALGGWAWVAVVASGACRIVQANQYECLRRQYAWWVYGTPWLRRAPLEGQGRGHALLTALAEGYLRLGASTAPANDAIDAILDGATPAQRNAHRDVIRRHFAPLLQRSQILSANYRTLALGGSMLAGTPLWFLGFEIVLLSLASLAIAAQQARVTAATRADLAQPSPSTSR